MQLVLILAPYIDHTCKIYTISCDNTTKVNIYKVSPSESNLEPWTVYVAVHFGLPWGNGTSSLAYKCMNSMHTIMKHCLRTEGYDTVNCHFLIQWKDRGTSRWYCQWLQPGQCTWWTYQLINPMQNWQSVTVSLHLYNLGCLLQSVQRGIGLSRLYSPFGAVAW